LKTECLQTKWDGAFLGGGGCTNLKKFNLRKSWKRGLEGCTIKDWPRYIKFISWNKVVGHIISCKIFYKIVPSSIFPSFPPSSVLHPTNGAQRESTRLMIKRSWIRSPSKSRWKWCQSHGRSMIAGYLTWCFKWLINQSCVGKWKKWQK